MKTLNYKRNAIELSSFTAQVEDAQAPMSLSQMVDNLCHFGKRQTTMEDEQIITATQAAYTYYVEKALWDSRKAEQPLQLKLLCEILLNLKYIDSKIAGRCNIESLNTAVDLLKN